MIFNIKRFGVKVPTISKHFKNIFQDGELDEQVVVSKMEIITPHGAIDEKTQTNGWKNTLMIESCFQKVKVISFMSIKKDNH